MSWRDMEFDEIKFDKIPINSLQENIEILMVSAAMAEWQTGFSRSEEFLRDCIEFIIHKNGNHIQINLLLIYDLERSFVKIMKVTNSSNKRFLEYANKHYKNITASTEEDMEKIIDFVMNAFSKTDYFLGEKHEK